MAGFKYETQELENRGVEKEVIVCAPLTGNGVADGGYVGWIEDVPLFRIRGEPLKTALQGRVTAATTKDKKDLLSSNDYENYAREFLNVIRDPMADSEGNSRLCFPFFLIEHKKEASGNTVAMQHLTQLIMYMSSVVDLAMYLDIPSKDFVIFGILGEAKVGQVTLIAMRLGDITNDTDLSNIVSPSFIQKNPLNFGPANFQRTQTLWLRI